MTAAKKTLSNAEKIASLKAQLSALESESNVSIAPVQETVVPYVKLQLDDMIDVMSLLPYPLILSTQNYGQGSTKRFNRFGEIKKILYKDLLDIMEVNSNFLESGYFYIMNASLVKQHGLDEIYSKILTKEKIEELLNATSRDYMALFNAANPKQQEVIVQILIDQVKANPDSVDMAMVDKISRASKINIMSKAEDEKELSEQER